MESQSESPKKEMELKEALEAGLIHGSVKAALEEFWNWYDWHYVMPVRIIQDSGYITLYIYYDISKELELCTDACIKEAKKRADPEEYTEEDIAGACYVACTEDIVTDINADFGRIRSHLFEYLDKYRLSYDWEDSWDYNTRYLAVSIRF